MFCDEIGRNKRFIVAGTAMIGGDSNLLLPQGTIVDHKENITINQRCAMWVPAIVGPAIMVTKAAESSLLFMSQYLFHWWRNINLLQDIEPHQTQQSTGLIRWVFGLLLNIKTACRGLLTEEMKTLRNNQPRHHVTIPRHHVTINQLIITYLYY